MSLLAWWREILIAVLVASCGVLYHLWTVDADKVTLLETQIAERQKRDEMRLDTNRKNKERTDAENDAARKRAAAIVVRLTGPGIKPGKSFAAPASGDAAAACIDGGRLGAELDGWATRTASRLTEVLRRDAGRSEDVARAGEGVAADYRSCRAWALNLVQAPGLKLATVLSLSP